VVVGSDGRRGAATLVSLNPVFDAWYLLALDWGNGSKHYYHLDNGAPETQAVTLDPGYHAGLMLSTGTQRYLCEFWDGQTLENAAAKPIPYAPLCGGRLFLRNAVRGRRSNLEAVVDFLRDHVWRGEEVVIIAKEKVLKDLAREQAALGAPPLVVH